MAAQWLAGLLEGEGSFFRTAGGSPVVSIEMTDRDVIERASTALATPMRAYPARKEGVKPTFQVVVKGLRAAHLMDTLWGQMSARRRSAIDRALAGYRGPKRSPHRCALPAARRADPGGRTRVLTPLRATMFERRPSQPIDDAELTIAWLAGILEGEGTFTVTKFGGRSYPVVKVTMTDEDTVMRAQRLMDTPGVYRREDDRGRLRGWSPTFTTQASGRRAAEIMREVRHLMGQRRRRAIDRALASYHPERLTDAPEHCVVDGCTAAHRSRGLCHKHYMSWMRDANRGRTPRVTPLR